jgi:gamma-glutamyltranspeptidase/glutathione hydrolase
MDDFSAKAGVPNLYGLTGSEANSIAPGKRMLSSMTPTVVEKNGKLFMVVGTQDLPLSPLFANHIERIRI